MGLWAPESKNRLQKSRETPPKMVGLTFVACIYHFWVSIKRILKFAHFLPILGHFPLVKRAKTRFGWKGTQKWPGVLVFWPQHLQMGPTKVVWGSMQFSICLPPPYYYETAFWIFTHPNATMSQELLQLTSSWSTHLRRTPTSLELDVRCKIWKYLILAEPHKNTQQRGGNISSEAKHVLLQHLGEEQVWTLSCQQSFSCPIHPSFPRICICGWRQDWGLRRGFFWTKKDFFNWNEKSKSWSWHEGWSQAGQFGQKRLLVSWYWNFLI